MSDENEEVPIRRTLEQVKHCVVEALSVIEHGEPMGFAEDDLLHAYTLLGRVRQAIAVKHG